jgi:hypothetical protein
MYLPAELHDAILQHLPKTDMSAYRLICRNFAENGAHLLFRKIHLTASLPDLKRLSAISKSDVRLCVKTLVWRTSGSESETEYVLEGLRTRELRNILGEPATGQFQQAQAPVKVEEGKDRSIPSIGVFFLQAIFSGLPNVQKIHVRSRYEMQVCLVAADLAGHRLSKLRAGYMIGKSVPAMALLEHSIGSLTSLRLQLSLTNDTMAGTLHLLSSELGLLRKFLGSAKNLRTLEILLKSNWWRERDFESSYLRLQDIISESSSFPHLRKFVIAQCDTSEDFLESFLIAHCETLKVLRLDSLRFQPPGSWPRLFRNVQPCLRLETVAVSGDLDEGVRQDMDWWSLGGALGWELRDFLLHKQTECPLRQDNKWQIL